MLRHRADRPWLICVHGTEMGRAAIDLTVFRAWHLYGALGLNVVLPVLPMHGPRGRRLPAGAVFPGEDVMDDVHATAQAVWDIRRLLSWIRTEQPGAKIGLSGISLGAYVSALVASLDDGLSCAILGVPVANLVEVLTEHAHLRHDDPRRLVMTTATPIGRMLSPLSMEPRVAMRGRFIYAGVADRLVNPREQVARLWEHWGEPQIVWYPGGHVGFLSHAPCNASSTPRWRSRECSTATTATPPPPGTLHEAARISQRPSGEFGSRRRTTGLRRHLSWLADAALPAEMLDEPVARQICDLFQCSCFLEQVSGTWDDRELARARHRRLGLAVELQYDVIASPDDQECRNCEPCKDSIRKVGPTAPGHDRTDRHS